MSKKITVRKLAEELGIAASTVHRALSGHQNVRKETRQKVLRTAQKKGYLLPQHTKKDIAVILPTLRVTGYLESLLLHLENEFHRRGFRLYLILQQDIGLLGDHMFDGILSLVWKKGLEKLLPQQFSIPVVTLNAAPNMLENIPMIASDSNGIRMALNYLHQRGCQRIFYLSTYTENDLVAMERLEEFRQFCMETGQEYETMHLQLSDREIPNNLPRILQTSPDACFCASETYAVELGHCLKAAGLRIPEDISLMGLEDRCNVHFSPPITSIRQNFEKLAETAAEVMSEILASGTIPKDCKIPFTLIERESVRKPKKRSSTGI